MKFEEGSDFMLVSKGKFVRIRKHILFPENRDKRVPDDTSQVPLKMWIKGRLLDESEMFEETEIITATGRIEKGILKEVEPKYKHTFGDYVEELQHIREIILKEAWGVDDKSEL